jgi:hypothetical protein
MYECERPAFRGLERGPVSIAIEHNNFVTVPDGCFGTTRQFMSVMTRLWVDDQDFVDALRSWHNMPVGWASIEHSENQTRNGMATWTLTPENASSSSFETPIVESTEGTSSTTRGYAWPDGGGVALLELDRTMTKYTANVLPAMGTMNSPTQWSQWAHGAPFVGRADIMNTVVLKPSLAAYADELCKVPVQD